VSCGAGAGPLNFSKPFAFEAADLDVFLGAARAVLEVVAGGFGVGVSVFADSFLAVEAAHFVNSHLVAPFGCVDGSGSVL